MNTNSRFILAVVFLLGFLPSVAQSGYLIGALPTLNLNKKINKVWALNAKLESRFRLLEGINSRERINGTEHLLTDFGFILVKKIGLHEKLGAGYLMRFEGEENINRFMQQFSTIQRLQKFRLSHRVVLDETLEADEPISFRFRYRLASEIPLSGQAVDVSEFYLKLSGEVLNQLQDGKYNAELRGIPMLGYALHPKHKLELGIDYRLGKFLTNDMNQTVWTSVNWYIEF